MYMYIVHVPDSDRLKKIMYVNIMSNKRIYE